MKEQSSKENLEEKRLLYELSKSRVWVDVLYPKLMADKKMMNNLLLGTPGVSEAKDLDFKIKDLRGYGFAHGKYIQAKSTVDFVIGKGRKYIEENNK